LIELQNVKKKLKNCLDILQKTHIQDDLFELNVIFSSEKNFNLIEVIEEIEEFLIKWDNWEL